MLAAVKRQQAKPLSHQKLREKVKAQSVNLKPLKNILCLEKNQERAFRWSRPPASRLRQVGSADRCFGNHPRNGWGWFDQLKPLNILVRISWDLRQLSLSECVTHFLLRFWPSAQFAIAPKPFKVEVSSLGFLSSETFWSCSRWASIRGTGAAWRWSSVTTTPGSSQLWQRVARAGMCRVRNWGWPCTICFSQAKSRCPALVSLCWSHKEILSSVLSSCCKRFIPNWVSLSDHQVDQKTMDFLPGKAKDKPTERDSCSRRKECFRKQGGSRFQKGGLERGDGWWCRRGSSLGGSLSQGWGQRPLTFGSGWSNAFWSGEYSGKCSKRGQ